VLLVRCEQPGLFGYVKNRYAGFGPGAIELLLNVWAKNSRSAALSFETREVAVLMA